MKRRGEFRSFRARLPNVKPIALCLLLPLALASSAQPAAAAEQESLEAGPKEIDASTKAAVIDTISAKLKELFLFPVIAAQMEVHLRSRLTAGDYDEATTLAEFTDRLTADLLHVYPDGHLEVSVLSASEGDMRPDEDEEAWWRRRVEEGRYNNSYFRRVEWLPGNIGYLDLRRFEYPQIAGGTAVAAMDFLSHTDAMIIDLRNNPGGRSELSQLLLSYFFEDHRVHYATSEDRARSISKQWWTIPFVPGKRMADTPLYVLTSYETGSAAEEFAYILKHLGRATLVGDTTAGAAHTTHRHMFPGLGIEMRIPDGTTISPVTGKDWEGTGVIPDVTVPADQALATAYGQALGALLENETDELKRFRLQWVKSEIEVRDNPIELKRKEKKQYVGRYGPRRISLQGGDLYYQRQGRSKFLLVPLGEDCFMLDGLDYFRVRFSRDESGAVTALIGVYDDGSEDSSPRTGK